MIAFEALKCSFKQFGVKNNLKIHLCDNLAWPMAKHCTMWC
jgi:hypothetical protein